MEPNRKKLLAEFVTTQVWQMPDKPPELSTECMSVGYGLQTQHDTGLTEKEMRKEMIAMRNDGIVELIPTVDQDGAPCGSGYFLTEHGLWYARQHFTPEEFEQLV